MKNSYNWSMIRQVALEDGPFESKTALANYLGIPVRTVFGAFERGDLPEGLIQQSEVATELTRSLMTFDGPDKMTIEDVIELYGIDTEEWQVVNYTVGMTQMVKTTDDDRPLERYRWYLKLKRRTVNLVYAEPRPVVVMLPDLDTPEAQVAQEESVVVFITDNHIGYVGDEPTFDEQFLEACYAVANDVKAQTVVWGGDVLDFAAFSRFIDDPAYHGSTQQCLNVAARWFGHFASAGFKQIYLKGNHENRIDRLLQAKAPMLYGLTVVNDQVPVLSLEHLLDLRALGVTYIDDYPDGEVTIDGVRYLHGTLSSGKSGGTVSSYAAHATVPTIHGHSHTREKVSKTVKDTGREIFVACPGWAGLKNVPGGRPSSNWHTGAYVITDGNEPELISRDVNGAVRFRGQSYQF